MPFNICNARTVCFNNHCFIHASVSLGRRQIPYMSSIVASPRYVSLWCAACIIVNTAANPRFKYQQRVLQGCMPKHWCFTHAPPHAPGTLSITAIYICDTQCLTFIYPYTLCHVMCAAHGSITDCSYAVATMKRSVSMQGNMWTICMYCTVLRGVYG